jgi:hypothetical protein
VAQIQFPNQLFAPGQFNIVVNDNNGTPSSVLEAAKDFTIDASWSIDPAAALLLGGQWEVAAYVESVGQGPEQQVGPTEIVPLNGTPSYSRTITVPAGTLPDNPAPPLSGVYKLIVVLIHRNFAAVSDVAAVAEGPFLRIG